MAGFQVITEVLGPYWQDSLRILLQRLPTLCVVLISPAADDQFWEDTIRQGGYDVLTKPLNEAALIQTIQFACVFWKTCLARTNGCWRAWSETDSGNGPG
jgi:FixJ family two-component response regulator